MPTAGFANPLPEGPTAASFFTQRARTTGTHLGLSRQVAASPVTYVDPERPEAGSS